jgi:hypothetical protein
MTAKLWSVTLATAYGAQIEGWQVNAGIAGKEVLCRELSFLANLGHIVGFSITPAAQPMDLSQVRERLVAHFGDLVMDAIRGQPLVRPEPAAAFFAAVAPFTGSEEGVLSSTLRFLNTEAEILAFPSFDDEAGFPLPGREGLYLPLFMPRFDRQSSVI